MIHCRRSKNKNYARSSCDGNKKRSFVFFLHKQKMDLFWKAAILDFIMWPKCMWSHIQVVFVLADVLIRRGCRGENNRCFRPFKLGIWVILQLLWWQEKTDVWSKCEPEKYDECLQLWVDSRGSGDHSASGQQMRGHQTTTMTHPVHVLQLNKYVINMTKLWNVRQISNYWDCFNSLQ